jgi:hypothetical protein
MRRFGTILLLAATLVFWPAPGRAAADSTDSTKAQLLFDEALALLDQNNAAEACPKLEQSLQLDPGIGTEFQLADCYARIGRRATAYRMFEEVARRCATLSAADHERVARTRKAALEGQLQYLELHVDSSPAGLSLYIDGVAIERDQWENRLPIDPGEHRFEAKAPGYEPLGGTVTVSPENQVTRVTIGKLQPEQPKPHAETTKLSAPQGTVKPRGAEKRPTTYRTIGTVTTGAGLASLTVGGIFGLVALSKKHGSDSECTGRICNTASATALHNEAVRAGDRSTAFFVAGGIFCSAGVALLLALPRQVSTSLQAQLTVGKNQASATVEGAF